MVFFLSRLSLCGRFSLSLSLSFSFNSLWVFVCCICYVSHLTNALLSGCLSTLNRARQQLFRLAGSSVFFQSIAPMLQAPSPVAFQKLLSLDAADMDAVLFDSGATEQHKYHHGMCRCNVLLHIIIVHVFQCVFFC